MSAESGTVQGVYDETLGSVLETDATAGDVTLYVSSVAFFAPNGGMLAINDGTNSETGVAYTGVDESTRTLTGVTPLAYTYDADDTYVSVWPEATNRVAEVRLDGQQDTVRARIPFSLFDRLATGYFAEGNGETLRVLVELQGEYVVTDVLGQVPEIATDTLTVVEDLIVEGTLTVDTDGVVALSSGSAMTLAGQQEAPATAPSISRGWYSEEFDPIPSTDADYGTFYFSDRRGAYHDTTDNKIVYCGDAGAGATAIRSVDLGTGVGTTVVSSVSNRYYGSVTRVGSFYYVLTFAKTNGYWYVRKYDTSWVYQSEWAYTPTTFTSSGGTFFASRKCLIASDGTDLYVCDITVTNGRVRIQRINTAGVVQATVNGTSTYEPDAHITGFLANVTLDFGAARYLVQTEADPDYVYPLNSSGVYQSNEVFRTASTTSDCYGLMSDGTNLWCLADGTGNTDDPATVSTAATRYKYELNWWTTESSKWWAAFSWYDSDATGGTHETTIGPKTSITMYRRSRLYVTTAAIPDNGGTDDPNAVRVYLGRGTTTPADSAMFLQYTGADGVTSGEVTAAVFTGTAAPTSNDFPGANAATIASGTQGTLADSVGEGLGWKLEGTGGSVGFADIQTFTADGTWNKPKHGGMTMAEIHLVGGGGGGGSGRRSSAGGAAGGGASGGGGSYGVLRVPLSSLSTTATVTVGAGGAGGAARTVNNNGNLGTDGEDTTFVSGAYTFTAKGGAGASGAATASAGGTPGTQSRASSAGIMVGGTGVDGAFGGPGTDAGDVPGTNFSGGAGAGGAGGAVSASTQYTGGTGGDSWDVGGTLGRAGTTVPSVPSTKMTGHAFPGAGGGGSGGVGVSTLANAVAGANGGLYGGGGGGGGGAAGYDSGAGGTGGQGIVVVVCY